MPENVQISIIREDLKEPMLRAAPLVDDLLHQIFVLLQPKTNRPLVRLAFRMTPNLQFH